jgi:3-hydroxybutyryl-CoA dehydrogenase
MTISKVAIIGSGTMGGGIAINAAQSGYETHVFDVNETMLEGARKRADRFFARLVEKGAFSPDQAARALDRFHWTDTLADIASADLVIEAIHEDLQAKREIFAKVSSVVSPDAIIATNTSALRVADLADAVGASERFLGMHYFSPAELNPLVELVSQPRTNDRSLQNAARFLEQTGKSVLRCRDANGFAVNRFFCPYANEAVRLLDEGIGNEHQIDQVARQVFDLAMGPFEVMNIVKPRIMLNAVGNLSGLGAFYEPAQGLAIRGETNVPWEIKPAEVDLLPHAVEGITDRLRGAVWLPVLEAAAERVAELDSFDQGAKLALRFGLGPVEMMRHAGRQDVARIVGLIAERCAHPMPEDGLNMLFH